MKKILIALTLMMISAAQTSTIELIKAECFGEVLEHEGREFKANTDIFYTHNNETNVLNIHTLIKLDILNDQELNKGDKAEVWACG